MGKNVRGQQVRGNFKTKFKRLSKQRLSQIFVIEILVYSVWGYKDIKEKKCKKNALKIYLSFQQETFGFLTKSEKKIKFLFAKTLQTHQKKLLIYSS